MLQEEKREFALTDDQVDNWRQMLVTMPLPPFKMALGMYALIMPRQQVVDVVYRLKELMEEELFDVQAGVERETVLHGRKEIDTHIIRTRPRNPNKPQRPV